MENTIKILSFEKNFVHTGHDKMIIDYPMKDFCQILLTDGWTPFHRNTGDMLYWSAAFWKEIDGLKISINVDVPNNDKAKTEITCRDWWTTECKKYFNLKK